MEPLRLLVVENDVAARKLMTEVLASFQTQVCTISSSEQAVPLVRQEKFDGIFLGIEMPNVREFALLRNARKSSWNRTTPVVIMSGSGDRDTMQEAFATGATFYLQKPIDKQKLTGLFRTVRGTMIENRRRSIRVPVQTEVTCSVGTKLFQGRTWNISVGGIQVESGNLNAGETVRLSFRLPSSSRPIEAFGEVVWAHETRQGIQFANLDRRHQEEIWKFVSQVEKA